MIFWRRRRQPPPRTAVPGVIWRWDHPELLTVEEYEHWLTRPLPFGWSIIAAPVAIEEEP